MIWHRSGPVIIVGQIGNPLTRLRQITLHQKILGKFKGTIFSGIFCSCIRSDLEVSFLSLIREFRAQQTLKEMLIGPNWVVLWTNLLGYPEDGTLKYRYTGNTERRDSPLKQVKLRQLEILNFSFVERSSLKCKNYDIIKIFGRTSLIFVKRWNYLLWFGYVTSGIHGKEPSDRGT